MSGLEDSIRETLRNHECEAPSAVNLLAGVHARTTRRRHRIWLATGASAAAVAVVGAVAVFSPLLRDDVIGAETSAGPASSYGVNPKASESADPHSAASALSATAQAAGFHVVSFHGLELTVPRSWTIDEIDCGVSLHNTVILDDGQAYAACLTSQTASVTVVHMDKDQSVRGREIASLATRATTVDGHRARTGTGTLSGGKQPITVLDVPDAGVVVSVASPDPAAAARIVKTVRVTPVDSNGCVDQVTSLTASETPARAGAADATVPGNPTGAAICRYADNALERSVALSPAETVDLVHTLNALPPGVSRVRGLHGGDCAVERRAGYVVQFTYPSGEPLPVTVHIKSCVGPSPVTLWASNGVRTTKINGALIHVLVRAAGDGGGFTDPTELY